MIRQYLEIKKQYPDAILFFRLGDFYEMFFDDALTASKELEITLTGRDGGQKERVPMCGVPYHAADGYIAKLIGRGRHVAICEQVEDPAASKGIVKREVVRVITPGTVMEGNLLEERRNNYLACAARGDKGYGLAVTDVTTGTFMVSSLTGQKAGVELTDELNRLMPAELVVPLSIVDNFSRDIKLRGQLLVSGYRDEAFILAAAERALEDQFGQGAFFASKISDPEIAACAAGALASFLKDTQKRSMTHINKIQFYMPGRYMTLDAATRRNLELSRSISDNTKKHTLLSVLDYTVTSMGGRMLRNWIEQPLLMQEEITTRQDAVDELVKNAFYRKELREKLKNIYDLERLAGKISFGAANARDLIALKKSLFCLPPLKELLRQAHCALLKEKGGTVDAMEDTAELLSRAIEGDPPLSLRDGGIIKVGFNSDVDKYRSAGKEARLMLTRLEERERLRTGIKSLKVGFNKVFGYYIEITKSNLDHVPEDYSRRQTLANAERYITPELKEYEDLVLGAQERLLHLEYKIFNDIREQLTAQIRRIQTTASAVAEVDALYSLAVAAFNNNYVRPEILNDSRLVIRDGRHPVLEKVMGPGQFVPNDTDMNYEESRLLLITGPNMAGKSTYMRQVAIIVLMAQTGSFVPASSAEVSLVDRIFTRIGASDDIASGQSTFMVEMNECRNIIAGATKKSLIVLDEVGRGTSTYDGISIARALAEYIHKKIKAKTLFSTHYFELTDLDKEQGITNMNVAVKEEGDQVIFLRKVIPGRADRSYGIHVARLAGLPAEIIERSAQILKDLEKTDKAPSLAAAVADNGNGMNNRIENEIIKELRHLDILSMTPLEAINKLYLLQKKTDDGSMQ
ncbi:MAG: DNA mismatch repair protein MutS [Desulfotomaculaceae bacterium]|nr:DNA mismatch repair protein MutS [Desulfotomaculaceae bacterium]MDD4766691.1 DNA mismatch repair protein MutS [Desulfotomaculaceae bacterium]